MRHFFVADAQLHCPCTCRETRDHEIARRKTDDGIVYLFWASGLVTTMTGLGPDGIVRARTAAGEALNRRAGQLVKEVLFLYGCGEVGDLVRAARRLVRTNNNAKWGDLVEVMSAA